MSLLAPTPARLRDGRVAIIRSAGPDDAAGLARLALHIAEERAYMVAEPDEAPTAEQMLQRIAECGAHASKLMLVATDEQGRVIGELECAAGARRRMAHRARIGLSVAQGWRSVGLGRALMERLLEWAEAHPTIERIVLGVFAENAPAIALYERLGFVVEGRRVREFKLGPGRYADDLIMAKFLKPKPAPREGAR